MTKLGLSGGGIVIIAILSLFAPDRPGRCADADSPAKPARLSVDHDLVTRALVFLKEHRPDFQAWRGEQYADIYRRNLDKADWSYLGARSGDFDADGHVDVAVIGNDAKSDEVLILFGEGPRFRIVDVLREPWKSDPKTNCSLGTDGKYSDCGFENSLNVISAGRVCVVDGRFEEIKTDSLEVVYDEKASRIFFYRNGQFRSCQGAD